MNDQEDVLNEFPLEGELQYPQQRSHDFLSLNALTDFINVFKIQSGQYGQLQNGYWRLIYNSSEN